MRSQSWQRILSTAIAALLVGPVLGLLISGPAALFAGSSGGASGGGGGGVTGLTSCADGTAIADDAIIRGDGTTKCQGSTVTLADSTGNLQWEGATADAFEGNFTFADPTADWTWAWGADGTLTGATQFNLENLRLDGNTISSTDTNGNIRLVPNGSGVVGIGATAPNASYKLDVDGGTGPYSVRFYTSSDNIMRLTSGAGDNFIRFDSAGGSWAAGFLDSSFPSSGGSFLFLDYSVPAVAVTFRPTTGMVGLRSVGGIGWTASNAAAALDTGLSRSAAGIVSVNDGTTGGGALHLTPMASPPRTCDATAEGDIYSDTSHALCWCDASTWQKLSGAGTCD